MDTLENRLFVEENIEVCEKLLEKLYKEREKIIKECYHEIRIISLEKNEEYGFYETKGYCLFCGKQFPNKRVVMTSERKPCIITITEFPNLKKKWGKNFKKEVEQVYMNIKQRFPTYSKKELYLKLRAKLTTMNDDEENF